MFKWLIKRFLAEFKGEIRKEYLKELFFEVINDEEVQKAIIEFTDDLYKRYAAKALGTVGGLQKGINFAEGGGGIGDIIDNKGHVSLKRLIPAFLSGFGNKQDESTSRLP